MEATGYGFRDGLITHAERQSRSPAPRTDTGFRDVGGPMHGARVGTGESRVSLVFGRVIRGLLAWARGRAWLGRGRVSPPLRLRTLITASLLTITGRPRPAMTGGV